MKICQQNYDSINTVIEETVQDNAHQIELFRIDASFRIKVPKYILCALLIFSFCTFLILVISQKHHESRGNLKPSENIPFYESDEYDEQIIEPSFDHVTDQLSLFHSESVYCDPSSYLTRPYKGLLSGFIPTYRIHDHSHDTEGYIGYMTNYSSIFITFRGSASDSNWKSNINMGLVKYNSCSNCQVHEGYYTTQLAIIQDVISEIKNLKHSFPSFTVVVTGHSLGGALATLTAADLLKEGISPIKLFNYGTPKIFNIEGAKWFSLLNLDIYRITHRRDIVPHLPLLEVYTQIAGEWYEPSNELPSKLVRCNGFSDHKCSSKWQFFQLNEVDHLWYEGIHIGANACDIILK
eukprot:gene3305-6543_t